MNVKLRKAAVWLGIVAAALGVVVVVTDLVRGDGLSGVGLVCIALGLSAVSLNVRRKKSLR